MLSRHSAPSSSRRTAQPPGLGLYLLGVGTGVLTNLVTAQPERWPGWLRPVVEWSWLICAVIVMAVGVRAVSSWWRRRLPRPEWTGGNPYPGLVAYEADRTGVFFGRSDELRGLRGRMQGAVALEQRFVPVVGPSGSGKSSLVLAGLLPGLADRWAVLPVITPGASGIDELTQLLGTQVRGSARTLLAAVRDGGPVPSPEPVLRAVRAARGSRQRVLVVVDQFEEAAVQHTQEEQQLFMALLYALVLHDPRLWVVVTVRSEWIGRFQQEPGAALFRVPFMVNVLEPRQIRQVMDGPARLTDTVFEEGLVDDIVRDTGRGDALPLLSSLLGELYDGLGRDRHVTRAAYERAGGVGGAIAGRAETALAASGHDRDTALTTLLLLVGVEGEELTRRPVSADALTTDQREVMAAFVRAHLLISDVGRAGCIVFAVAHEALLRQWRPLAERIETHRGTLRRITELLPLAQAWEASGRSTAYLVPSERFAELTRVTEVTLPEPLAEFVTAAADHDTVEVRRWASVAGSRALEVIGHDPATAISLALAACTELAPTSTAATALYRSMATGLRHVLTGHTGLILRGAVAPDGRVATADREHTIRIWAEDGTLLHALPGHEDIGAMSFGSDGRLASVNAKGQVILWDADGRMIRELGANPGKVTRVVFGADGQLAAAGNRGICLWDADGEPLRQLTGRHPAPMVAFTPNGHLVTASRGGPVQVWHRGRSKPNLLKHARAVNSPVTALAVSRDGHIAVGHHNGFVHVWRPDRKSLRSAMNSAINDLVFSDSGHLAALTARGTVVLTLAQDGIGPVPIAVTDPHWSPIAYGPGDLLAVANGGEVQLYGPDGTIAHVCTMNSEDMRVLDFGSQGRLLTTAGRGAVHVWDTGKDVARQLADNNDVYTHSDVVVAPDGRFTTSTTPSDLGDPVVVRDLNGRVLHHPHLTGPGPHQCAFGPDGHLAVTTDMCLDIWDVEGAPVHRLKAEGRIEHIAIADDGRLAAAAGDTVLVWNAAGRLLHTFDGHADVRAVTFGPAGRLAFGTATGAVWLCDTDGELLPVPDGPDDAVQALAFAEDGRLAAGSVDRTVRVWDRDGTSPHTLSGHLELLTHLVFARCGRLVTRSMDGAVRVWRQDGSLLHVLEVAPYDFSCGLDVTSAGLVVTGDGDGTIRVWGSDGQLLYVLPSHADAVRHLALTADDQLITASRDGTVKRWPAPVSLPELVANARRCNLPPIPLTLRHQSMLPTHPPDE